MYAFDYKRPESLAAASAALTAAPGAKLLAGGQTMIPTLKFRLANPGTIVDLSRIAALKGVSAKDGAIVIGAMTTHAAVAENSQVRMSIPGLCAVAAGIGDPQVRNRGTIGGSVANNDPAADYPAAVLALGATMITNKRAIAADQFFRGLFETALAEDEIITEISVPVPKGFAYAKFANPASRYALVGVAVCQTDAGVRVAVTGAGSSGVFRWTAAEQALSANFSAAALAGMRVDTSMMMSDVHAAADYRAHLVSVMTTRAITG